MYLDNPLILSNTVRPGTTTTAENAGFGFRLVMIPEPGSGVLMIAGMLGLTGWRRKCPSRQAP